MGNLISDVLSGGDKESHAKEQLDVMMKLADARLDVFEGKLKTMFLDKNSAAKTSVPGHRALRFERSVRVDTNSAGAPGVFQAVDAFFGAKDTGADGVLAGFKAVVQTGLNQILGNNTAGESYDEKFFVCLKHNAIIRVDMLSYRYNYSDKGIKDMHKNVFAYILCTSVVDHKDLTVDELVYLASEFAGDKTEEYNVYLTALQKVWENLRKTDALMKKRLEMAEMMGGLEAMSLQPAAPVYAPALLRAPSTIAAAPVTARATGAPSSPPTSDPLPITSAPAVPAVGA